MSWVPNCVDYKTLYGIASDTMERNCQLICEHGIDALTGGSGYDLQVRGYGRWVTSMVSSDQNHVMVAVISTLKAIEEQMMPPPVRMQKEFPICFFRKVDVLPTGTLYSTVPFSAVLRRVKEFLQRQRGDLSESMREGARVSTDIYNGLDFKLSSSFSEHENKHLNFFIRECRMAVASKNPLDKEQVVRSVMAQLRQELASAGLKEDPYGPPMPNIQDVLIGAWATRHAKDAAPHPH